MKPTDSGKIKRELCIHGLFFLPVQAGINGVNIRYSEEKSSETDQKVPAPASRWDAAKRREGCGEGGQDKAVYLRMKGARDSSEKLSFLSPDAFLPHRGQKPS